MPNRLQISFNIKNLQGSITGRAPGFAPEGRKAILLLPFDFRLSISNELDLLEQLLNAGILNGRQTWRFAHDTFEEYFCACRLARIIEETGKMPDLQKWRQAPTEFIETLQYFAELALPQTKAVFLSAQVPEIWKATVSPPNAPGG